MNFDGPVAHVVSEVLFHSLWQGAIVGIATWIVLASLRNRSARSRYATACAGLLLLVVAPMATVASLDTPSPGGPAAPPGARSAPVMPPSTAIANPGIESPISESTLSIQTEAWRPTFLLLWVAGIALLCAWNGIGLRRVRVLRSRGTDPAPSPIQERFDRLAARTGVACELLVSRLVQVPTVLGHFRPVVLLPLSALTGLTPQHIEALLLHELAHVRRHDYLVNLLQTVVETMLFFHPAVWWISHRIRVEREFCCDDFAVAEVGDPRDYANALATMEETRHTGLALAANGGMLLRRVQRVLGVHRKRANRPGAVVFGSLGSVALAGIILGCAAWQDRPTILPDRAAFAAKMATIREGMTKAEVIRILGKPDDVVTAKDKIIGTHRTKEILGYGNGKNRKQFVVGGKVEFRVMDGTHLSFPTLGCVYIDANETVQYVFGGKAPKPVTVSETKLRELLEIIDHTPPYRVGPYTPRAVIETVNALQPLGKAGALAVMDEYLRVASRYHSTARQGLFLVLRVLFDVPIATGFHRAMYVGAPLPAAPKDPRVFPRFPISLVDDTPYLLIQGYRLAGEAEPVENHVAHFRKTGAFRNAPLRPATRGRPPFDALRAKFKSAVEHSDVVLASLAKQWTSMTGKAAPALPDRGKSATTDTNRKSLESSKDSDSASRVLLPDDPNAEMTALIADLKRPTRLVMNFANSPMDKVVTTLAKISGTNILVSKKAEQKQVTIRIFRTSLLDTLAELAKQSGNFVLVADGAVRIISEEEAGLRAKVRGANPPLGKPQGAAYTPVLEMRMVAKRRKGLDVNLRDEKQRLVAWLAKDKNREETLANPARIASFHSLATAKGGRLSKQILWVPHRIQPTTRNRFGYSFSRDDRLGDAVCTTFSGNRLDAGPTSNTDALLEFLAVDLKDTGFGMLEFQKDRFATARDAAGQMALSYELRPEHADAYAELTDRRTGDSMAILLDGYLVSAPRIMSRIPGRGQIMGLSEETIARFMRAIRRD